MTYLVMAVAGFFALMALMQVMVRVRAGLLKGKPLPELPRAWQRKLQGSRGALVYFFSPGCAACRPLTPRFKEMSTRRPMSVFAVDVAQDLDLARALKVMATPSVVEIADGKVVGYHVGPPPAELMGRYA